MKKFSFLIAAFMMLCSLSTIHAAERIGNVKDLDTNCNGMYEEGEVNPCAEYRTGPCVCYCPVTKFRPKYYCEKRCVEEPYCVQKKCTRYVPQYYEKKCCRYVPEYYTKTFCRKVPQYYTQTYCRQVPECYYVTETKYRKRYVSERKCRYEPYTTIEKCCVDEPVCGSGGCASGSCPAPVQYSKPAGAADYQMQPSVKK